MKVLNFGSLNIDYVYDVDHFVQPGETISSNNLEIFHGGKGFNQSIALSRAGITVFHAGMIGDDGEELLLALKDEGIDVTNVRICESKTGHAVIQIDKTGQNSIILYGGSNQHISKEFIDEVLDSFSKGDIILLQNEINNIDYIINKAYEKEMFIAFNPSPINGKIGLLPMGKVNWFILNEIEGMAITGETDKNKIAESMLQKFPESKIVLTLGEDGVLYLDKNQRHSFGVYNVKVEDTTGAGDTFTGYFMANLIQGNPIPLVLEKASRASALAISKKGASNAIPTKEQVESHKLQLK